MKRTNLMQFRLLSLLFLNETGQKKIFIMQRNKFHLTSKPLWGDWILRYHSFVLLLKLPPILPKSVHIRDRSKEKSNSKLLRQFGTIINYFLSTSDPTYSIFIMLFMNVGSPWDNAQCYPIPGPVVGTVNQISNCIRCHVLSKNLHERVGVLQHWKGFKLGNGLMRVSYQAH